MILTSGSSWAGCFEELLSLVASCDFATFVDPDSVLLRPISCCFDSVADPGFGRIPEVSSSLTDDGLGHGVFEDMGFIRLNFCLWRPLVVV